MSKNCHMRPNGFDSLFLDILSFDNVYTTHDEDTDNEGAHNTALPYLPVNNVGTDRIIRFRSPSSKGEGT